MTYTGITTGDKNPAKRFLQRRRLLDALSVPEAAGLGDEGVAGTVLDFGGGAGEFTKMLCARFPNAEVVCYEPAPAIFDEAKRNLRGVTNAALVSSLEGLEGRRFGYVFCLEVFEHLPPHQTGKTIKLMHRALAKGGTAVVGVPNELFLPALVKGLFRIARRRDAFDARPGNILRAAVGRPPKERPLRRIAPGLPYHYHHMGFDHRVLEDRLSERFEVVRTFGSPVPWGLNTEVYFVLKKRALAPRRSPEKLP